MDYLGSLLDSLGRKGFAQASQVGPGAQYALVLDEDVTATLSTSEDQEYCLLTATLAARLPARPDAASDPWLHHTADPHQPHTFDQLSVNHATGHVTLQRCLLRSTLDCAGLHNELSQFVQRYRGWESVLSLLPDPELHHAAIQAHAFK